MGDEENWREFIKQSNKKKKKKQRQTKKDKKINVQETLSISEQLREYSVQQWPWSIQIFIRKTLTDKIIKFSWRAVLIILKKCFLSFPATVYIKVARDKISDNQIPAEPPKTTRETKTGVFYVSKLNLFDTTVYLIVLWFVCYPSLYLGSILSTVCSQNLQLKILICIPNLVLFFGKGNSYTKYLN